jgi:hypothetical protein
MSRSIDHHHGGTLALGTGLAAVALLRVRSLRWGATDRELTLAWPGDDLMTHADLISTRAVTIHARAEDVWPWIAQLGQGRGGFYSYDFVENLVGCDIHSSDTVLAEWQDIQVGSKVRLAPEVPLTVALVEPGRALVLRGGIPMGAVSAPYDFTWAFALQPIPGGSTRLVVRERYTYTRRWAALLVEPVQLISLVMSQRMMRGIKQRTERTAHSAQPTKREIAA